MATPTDTAAARVRRFPNRTSDEEPVGMRRTRF